MISEHYTMYKKNIFRILIPSTWKNINATDVESLVFEDGDVQVNTKSGVFGNTPYTLQTGGCGEEGEYIQVSNDFIENYENINGMFGPAGQVFVHEWAKYRYGVFDEFGYPGDEKYPMFFHRTQWTTDGQVNKLTPNFCTNLDLTDYYLKDWTTGGNCQTDATSGLPNINCVPVIGEGNTINSSIMAIPYLNGNNQFCDDTETFYHHEDSPTKQNDLCKGQSTFTVIKQHDDFIGYSPIAKKNDTIFEIVRAKSSSSFVMVIDVSGSMGGPISDPRLSRLKQSSQRWLEYDLKDGVSLGITTFSTEATVMANMTTVNNESRPGLSNVLGNLTANGSTCLGAGLKKGLDVLKGSEEKGGVMIFLTDGVHQCEGSDKSTINDVIQFIKDQEVRVITIAFSNDADQDLINLAKETDGKAFFVPDLSGPEVINTAMQGSLTYQPSVPSNEVDIIIFEQTYKKSNNIFTTFIIDEMLGKDVTIQIDFSGNPGVDIQIYSLNTTDTFTEETGVFLKSFSELGPESYNLSVTSKTNDAIGFASFRITAKAKSETIPIMTNCWTSLGNSVANMSTNTKIAVIARVLQGTNPVIGARVTAYIESEYNPSPLEISLLDTGSNPDNVANDGVYARYFTTFDSSKEPVRYSLKCQVEGTDSSQINQGFIDARRHRIKRSLPSTPSMDNPICCGSNTVTDNSILKPTGNFRRASAGGSIEVHNGDQANYPPGEVSNLIASIGKNNQYITLRFTSTGEKLDFGTADEIRIYYTNNRTELSKPESIINNIPFLNASQVLNPNSLKAAEGGTEIVVVILSEVFEQEQQYWFKLVTIARSLEAWSNTASVFIHQEQPSLPFEDGLKPGAVAGMVLGSILTVFVVAGAIFLYKRSLN